MGYLGKTKILIKSKYRLNKIYYGELYSIVSGACPGIRKGGGAQNLKAFFYLYFLLFNFSGGGPSSENDIFY